MPGFAGKRVVHEFTQLNEAPPESVFPLLCPVREAEWVPDWRYKLIYSHSGLAEQDCVFVTPEKDGGETVWQCTHYDPVNFLVAYAWVRPGFMTAQLRILLEARSDGKTNAHIRYAYTALSEAGKAELAHMNRSWFDEKMTSWQTAINHYLRTGKLIDSNAWE